MWFVPVRTVGSTVNKSAFPKHTTILYGTRIKVSFKPWVFPSRDLSCDFLENHPRNFDDDCVDEGRNSGADHLGVAGEKLWKKKYF